MCETHARLVRNMAATTSRTREFETHGPMRAGNALSVPLGPLSRPVVDSGSREIRAGKVHIYQLEVKMTGAVMLYTAFYNFSQAVWGLMAPTILPVHTVGYHWQHESTNRVSVLSLFMHTRAALSIFSLLL